MEEGAENAVLLLLKPYVDKLVEEAVTNTLNAYFAVNGIDQHIATVIREREEVAKQYQAKAAQQATSIAQQMGMSKLQMMREQMLKSGIDKPEQYFTPGLGKLGDY